ncbi:16S rRNA (uracil(1498)-N(3))-methyltransferase [Parathalassolituus penaei]|uniref:Ribosomal RNA small subunit methyltransferase E n=1 Tax=Parathalassolituus penaei TaxID=2997323 RepID=A0A9X3IVF7_9GAMM|nr:16S rRNA (uracil(1498)-N(3))-methyltransferase [Parathalassolituus penaei]MCY0967208.1 16S rRNA (uracil(1498)-N(3))-methyltransferase [Parathalassolituus penaei]
MPTRIYTSEALVSGQQISLDEQAFQHLVRVLRMTDGDCLVLFNGDGRALEGTLCEVGKKQASVLLGNCIAEDAPTPVALHLGQVISKGDRMDFTIQKATELGVTSITPLWSERCDVRLKGERMDKKLEHWRKVAISACEQSGRNRIPEILEPMAMTDWAPTVDTDQRLILHPHNQQPLDTSAQPGSVTLLVGPEGGFSEIEVEQAQRSGFTGLLLGPRILRTETAALAALSVLQYLWGDFRA